MNKNEYKYTKLSRKKTKKEIKEGMLQRDSNAFLTMLNIQSVNQLCKS